MPPEPICSRIRYGPNCVLCDIVMRPGKQRQEKVPAVDGSLPASAASRHVVIWSGYARGCGENLSAVRESQGKDRGIPRIPGRDRIARRVLWYPTQAKTRLEWGTQLLLPVGCKIRKC